MSAFTPPRADFKGGKQSEDSPAISRSIFTPSTTLCLFASELSTGWLHERCWINPHRLGLEFLPETAESVGRRFLNMTPFRGIFGGAVGEVKSSHPHGSSALTGHMTVMWAARCAHNNTASAAIHPRINSFLFCAQIPWWRGQEFSRSRAKGVGAWNREWGIIFFLFSKRPTTIDDDVKAGGYEVVWDNPPVCPAFSRQHTRW